MTKARLKKQVKELLAITAKRNAEEIDHLINSGAIDFSEEPDGSYTTARVVLCTLLKNTANSYSFCGKAKKDYQNLSKF